MKVDGLEGLSIYVCLMVWNFGVTSSWLSLFEVSFDDVVRASLKNVKSRVVR